MAAFRVPGDARELNSIDAAPGGTALLTAADQPLLHRWEGYDMTVRVRSTSPTLVSPCPGTR